MTRKVQKLTWIALLLASASQSQGALVTVEAESGSLGANFLVGVSGGATYISNTNNNPAANPGIPERVATYSVTFPQAGTYDLYARVLIGSGAANDDSFFYASSFGPRSATNTADWILCNNLWNVGFTNPSDVVTGAGTVQSGVWKWLDLSQFNGGQAPLTFTVTNGNLTQTFQLGGREDGLGLDKFAFGTTGYNFTVSNLDAGTDGILVLTNTGACRVNWNDVRQRIDGFGASSAWRSTWNDTAADRYFSTNTGIGLSLLRTRIAPGGTTIENAIMTRARDRGARVWSAPWSPLTSFKTANESGVLSLNGGSFIGVTSNYQAYANQLAAYVVNMKTAYSVTLYALSVQNEPDFITTNYESCGWSAQQIHDFVPYLSAALAASNAAATKIIVPESDIWSGDTALYTTTMNDANVAPLVSVIANHNYVQNNNAGDQTTPAAIPSYGKALWETEVSTFDAFDAGITNAIYWAKRVHGFLTVAQANAWHYWWLSASDNSGLANSSDVLAKRAYILGQYSRFVRPDSYRIGVVTNSGAAMVSGFKDPVSLKFVVVAINPGGTFIDQTFTLTNFATVATVTPWLTSGTLSLASQSSVTVTNSAFRYTLPPMSVTTFVGFPSTNSPPVLGPIPDRTVNAGTTLTLTNSATDPDAPPQTLTFGLLNPAPTNALLNLTNGILTWRPLVQQANSTNQFTVKVSDNGTPSLSATNTFKVTVNPLLPPLFSSVSLAANRINLSINGDAGPDYTLLSSTNLVDWQVLLVTNPAVLPFSLTDTNLSDVRRFYRLQLGP
jgi:O-glycosyl hydrolase